MRNLRYYLGESFTLLRLGIGRAVLSVLSLGLLLLFSMASLTIWIGAAHYVDQMKQETMIAVYYTPQLNEHALSALEEQIRGIDGAREVMRISKEESLREMMEMLGEEASILSRFAENPFEAYLRVSVSPEFSPESADALKSLTHVTYVRDHREVLTQVKRISDLAALIGALTVTAAIASTVMITYFVTKEAVLSHSRQIVDLRLMGAPEGFIRIPFLLQGVMTNLVAALVATACFVIGVRIIPAELRQVDAAVVRRALLAVVQLASATPLIGLIAGLRAVSSKRNLA